MATPTGQFAEIGLQNAMVPKEGPRAIPINVDLTTSQSVDIDLSQLSMQNKMSFVQTVWIDNSLNPAALILTVGGSRQQIKVPAGWQIIAPAFSMLPPQFNVASTGGVIVPIHFLNIPLPAYAVPGGGNIYTALGYLKVSDVVLDALVASYGGTSPVLPVAVLSHPNIPAGGTPWKYLPPSGGIINAVAQTIKASGGSGTYGYICSFQILNNSATETEVIVSSDAGNIWRGITNAKGFQSVNFAAPQSAGNNNNLYVQCVTTATQTYFNAQGYMTSIGP